MPKHVAMLPTVLSPSLSFEVRKLCNLRVKKRRTVGRMLPADNAGFGRRRLSCVLVKAIVFVAGSAGHHHSRLQSRSPLSGPM
jgi:hypothetical protein